MQTAHSAPDVSFVSPPGQFAPDLRIRGLVLAAFDLVGIVLAGLLGLLTSLLTREFLGVDQPLKVITAPVLLSVFAIPALAVVWGSSKQGHYSRIKPFWTESRELVRMIAYASALAVGATFVMKADVSRIWLLSCLLSLLILAPLLRLLAKRFLVRLGRWYAPLIVIGDRNVLNSCEKAITSEQTLGYRVAVRVDATFLSEATDASAALELVSTLQDLAGLYKRPRLLLAFDHRDILEFQQTLLDAVSGHFEHVVVAKQMYGLPALNAEPLSIDKHDLLFFRLSANDFARHQRLLKRAIDVVGASFALLLTAPLLLWLVLWIRRDGGRAIYGSERIGLNGRRFKCYKLRSMRENGDEFLREHLKNDAAAREEWHTNFKLQKDPRITRVGHFLRKSSLDELPQFINVLRGDMSLVGPRPILLDELTGYGRSILLYQGVRPGLTGLWQISGRSELKYDDRIRLNKWYVRNWSLWLDFSILFRTLPAVLASRGAL